MIFLLFFLCLMFKTCVLFIFNVFYFNMNFRHEVYTRRTNCVFNKRVCNKSFLLSFFFMAAPAGRVYNKRVNVQLSMLTKRNTLSSPHRHQEKHTYKRKYFHPSSTSGQRGDRQRGDSQFRVKKGRTEQRNLLIFKSDISF